MSTPASYAFSEIGDLSVQYVRRRQMLRVVNADEDRGGTVEVSLLSFLRALGIEPAELSPNQLFLLFACVDERPAGGMGDLAGTFATEEEARAEFHRLREGDAYRSGWAEVVALGTGGRTRPVCWFGRPPTPGPDQTSPVVSVPRPEGQSRQRRWPRRRRSLPR